MSGAREAAFAYKRRRSLVCWKTQAKQAKTGWKNVVFPVKGEIMRYCSVTASWSLCRA